MALYSVNNRMAGSQQVLTTTFKTQLCATAATATLCRGRIWEVMVGADGAPNATDCQIVYDVARKDASTAGTSTATTPVATNPADPATSRAVIGGNYTAEPTVYTSLLTLALNQRASQRWVAFSPDQALVWAATNLVGMGVRALSPTYAANVLAEVVYEDM